MPGKSIPLTPVDTVWYRMDRPVNHVMVTSVIMLQTPVDFQRAKEVFEQRLLTFDRFLCRVVEKGFPTPALHWERDPHFDIDNHIHHVALPEPGDKQALLELIGDLASTSIDYERPLWQVHVIDHVGHGSAIVTRFHHCLADGTAMMAVSSRLLDQAPDGSPELPTPRSRRKRGLMDRLLRPVKLVGNLAEESVDALTHPRKTLGTAALAAEGVGLAALTAVKTPDPKTPLRGHLSGKQRVTYSEPVSLAEVKAIGKAANATVNDVLVAGMAGALRRYILEHGGDVSHNDIRAVVPMDLRPKGKAMELGNAFGLVFLDLPVHEADPLERLKATKRGMDSIKRSPEAAVLLNIMSIMGHTPKTTEDLVSNIFASKATLVLTNVAGPKEQLYIAGCPIENIVFWVPHPVDMSTGISIFSYNGYVTLGVITDAGVAPDPQVITDQFSQEFAQFKTLLQSAPAPSVGAGLKPARTKENSTEDNPAPAAGQCAATTRSGQPCKNKARPGSAYCRVHGG